jgi:hypothetical protein
MTRTTRGIPARPSRPFRAGATTVCIAALLLGGCASTKDLKPKFLAVPVTYERHLDAVRNCTPIGAMTYFDKDIPNEPNLLGLVFSLHKASESSTTHSQGSGGTVWAESSSRNEGFAGVRLFRCPPEFLDKVRAEMKGVAR